jgi:Protein of unknown function (DUF2505)
MRFQAEHRFSGSPGAVAAILADPAFYLDLQLPDLSQPTVLNQGANADESVLRLRYLFVGSLDPTARRLLGRRELAWIQEIAVDGQAGSGQLTFHAEAQPKRLHGSARFTLEAQGDGTIRRLAGELVVAVPIVGARAERSIVNGLRRRLDIEADQLERRLRG